MKLNNISKLALVGILSLSTSCRESLEDININPYQPENVPTSGIFNSAAKELMDATRNSFESGRMTLPWVQYSAQVNYTEEDRFQFRQSSSTSLYTNLFRVAKDYKSIIEANTDNRKVQASKYGSNENQIAVARIMLSYVFSTLADTYGSIPYYSYGNQDTDFQALDLEKYPQPLYAPQAKIYADILDELKKASEQIDTSNNKLTGDAIFGGNMTKWKRFANSLRLRVANRLNGVIPTAQAHINDAIASGVMQSNDDNAVLFYQNDLLLPSPMYSDIYVNSRTDFKISNTMVEALKGNKGGFGLDPRLFKYAAPVYLVDNNDNYVLDANNNKVQLIINPNNPPFTYNQSKKVENYIGMPYGLTRTIAAGQNAAGASYWSNNVIKANFGEVLMEYSEVEFILSEVNGWNQTNYTNGVKASLEKWGVDAVDIASFVSNLPAANKENVLNQKYIALFMQPQEAYAEWRRTGYPNFLIKPGDVNPLLTPVKDKAGNITATTYTFQPLSPAGYTLTEMPSRITYPVTLQRLNPKGYESGIKDLGTGGDRLDTKLIWDKN